MAKQNDLTTLFADVREQVLYLQELGVETFDVNLSATMSATSTSIVVGERSQSTARPAVIPESQIPKVKSETKVQQSERPPGSRLSGLPSLAKRPTSTTQIKITEMREINPLKNSELDGSVRAEKSFGAGTETLIETSPKMPEPTETIDQIRVEIGPDCQRCKLSQGRTQVVNSTGRINAELMFVGEAPGADEDEQGFPFVGRAGQLLTKIIESIGLSRDDVFIGNINRCRPPGNRAPEPDETEMCRPFLQREIAVVRPRVIVVLGATAAHNLLETKIPIGKLRGHFHDYLGTKVMPTFHPAYLLRDPHKKREVWEDMKMVREYLNSVWRKHDR